MKSLLYFFIFVFLVCGCSKEYSCESCNQPPPPTTPPNQPELPEPPPEEPVPPVIDPQEQVYANFLANSESVYINLNLSGVQPTRSAWTNGPSYCLDGFFITGIKHSSEKPYFSFIKNAPAITSMEQAKTVFAVDEYPFLTLLADPVDCCPCRDFSDGVALNFVDSTGTFWATYLGVQPPDASLVIQRHKEYKSKLYIEGGFGGAFFNEQGERRIIYGSFRFVVWE